MADTGMRVPFRTYAPLTLPGTLSQSGIVTNPDLPERASATLVHAPATGSRNGVSRLHTHGIIGCGFQTIEPPPERSGFLPGSSFFNGTRYCRPNAAAISERTSRI